MVNNSLANCITLIRNGLHNKKHFVLIQRSMILYSFLDFLIKQGFILSYSFYNDNYLKVYLRYNQYGKLILRDIRLLSTKSRRFYIHHHFLKKVKSSVLIFIVSTTKGYLTHQQALQQKIGGELIAVLV